MRRLLLLAAMLAIAGPAAAQPDPTDLRAVVDKAYDFLKSRQKEDGSFEPARGGPGTTGLIAIALIRLGKPADDPVVAKALAFLEKRVQKDGGVFSPGLAEVVLEEYGRPLDPARSRLTEREADVLRLVVEGLTARQIAARLVLSPRTVEHHIQRVLRRLGVPNRAALVRRAVENGLV